MSERKIRILSTIVIMELVIIIILVASGFVIKTFRVRVEKSYEIANPLQLAVHYEVSDTKFEELVKKNIAWLPYRPDFEDSQSRSILSICADYQLTNYVRILIANGANVEEAVNWHSKYGSVDAVKLLRLIESEKRAIPGL